MSQQLDKSSLNYLGEEYQFKLVKEFMEDKDCFKDLAPIIDQNMFTGQYLRMYVGAMLEYYRAHGEVPSYSSMSVELKQRAHTQADIEICDAIINKIKKTQSDGSEQTRELATKFFKQQNIIKAAHEMLRLAGSGEIDNYERCEQLLKDALNTGTHQDYEEARPLDGLEETLSSDFRITIPTGIDKVDDILNGGIGKGELGVIVGPSSFGKVQPLDAKIVTPSGIVAMGDIKVGSVVIGADGKAHNVIAVFPHKDWDFYKVRFNDGSFTECGLEHLWEVYDDKGLKRVVQLVDLREGKVRLPRIKLTKPVEFDEKEVTMSPEDLVFEIKNGTKPYEIPHEYLFNSIEIRERLLNSLLKNFKQEKDTTGIMLLLPNDKLIVDIIILCESLGYNKPCVLGNSDGTFVVFVKSCRDRFLSRISYSRKCDGQCIKIDSDDELYLTDDFIVTHNTSMTTLLAANAAVYKSDQNLNRGFKVLQIVFEDRIKQIQRKHLSKITQVEACDLSKEEYIDYVKECIANYPDKDMINENLRIIRLRSGEKSVEFIISLIKKHIDIGFRPDLVIIDYFECIKLTGTASMSKWEKETSIIRKIEATANELNIAIWLPVQGNRESIKTDLVTMDNSGGSIGKIQTAHIIITITRSKEDRDNDMATIRIDKNRAGDTDDFRAIFRNGTCTITTDGVEEVDGTEMFNSSASYMRDNELDRTTKVSRELFVQMRQK